MNLLASLRYPAALDEHRHFGRAAQACHITQRRCPTPCVRWRLNSALSSSSAAVILKVSRREGMRVLASAQRMLHERELLQQDLDSGLGKPHGSLTIGAVPTAMPIVARFAGWLHSRHPGITPTVRSMSSNELEAGLESLSLDMGLGYTDRLRTNGPKLPLQVTQYTEHYFFVRRAVSTGTALQIGPVVSWAEAGRHPLCLLTREMHNRTIVEKAFADAGTTSQPVMEFNSS